MNNKKLVLNSENTIIFFKQLSVLFKKNINIIDACKMLLVFTIKGNWQQVLKNLHADLQHGMAFDLAIKHSMPYLNNFVINIISIGEFTNQRPLCTALCANYLENKLKQKKIILKQMIYPVITIIMACIVILLMQHLVIPGIREFYQNIMAPIPVSINYLSSFITWCEIFIFLFILFTSAILFISKKKANFKNLANIMIIKVPFYKQFKKLDFCYSFCLSFKILLACNLTPTQCLEKICLTYNNQSNQSFIQHWLSNMHLGVKLSDIINECGFMPKIMASYINIGENSGDLLSSFEYLSDYFQDQIQEFFFTVNKWLEPAIVLGLGLIIGTLTLCIYYPIFQLSLSL